MIKLKEIHCLEEGKSRSDFDDLDLSCILKVKLAL